MKANRARLVERAFDKLDSTDDGVVTLADLKGVYTVDRHPLYLSGEKTEDQILAVFLKKFDNQTAADGKVIILVITFIKKYNLNNVNYLSSHEPMNIMTPICYLQIS